MVRERVKRWRPIIRGTFQFNERFDRLKRMYLSDHKAVVPLSVTVIQMHPQDTRLARGQDSREGRPLVHAKHRRKVRRRILLSGYD